MTIDIDMESYAGGKTSDPAAVGQQVVDTNSYHQGTEDYPVQADLLDKPPAQVEAIPEPVKEVINPQSENFRALREEVDRIKVEKEAEKREYQVQLEMLRANLAQQQYQKQPEPVQSKRMFDGMKEDDVPNVAEIRAEMNREWAQKEQVYQAKLEELQVQQQHPDYAEVIEKYALPLVKQKPHLAEGLQGASNKALFAYELGKMAQQMQGQQVIQQKAAEVVQRSENAQRMVENSRKPGTLSQAGGQAALSKADYFASMSDQEFMKMATKNLEGI